MHKGFTLWFTGLSGSGKSTLTHRLEKEFRARNYKVEVLDGDVVRTNLSRGLSFSKEDRDINVRRIGFVCDLLSRNGVIAISAAISPYQAVRDECRALIGGHGAAFVEVYTRAALAELINRDPKGLYQKAIAGELPNFTGVSDPYEEPTNPEISLDTDRISVDDAVSAILNYLEERGLISASSKSSMIDLHAHTTHSDGTLSPRQLVEHAREKDLSVLAITDHDTSSAVEEAMAAGVELGVRVLPGIELSVEDDFDGTFARFHLLAYCCAPDSELLSRTVPFLQSERDKRNHEVLQVHAEMQMPLDYDELRALGGSQIGRPHIAQLLMEKGHVESLQEAFDKYLDASRPAYRPKVVLKARDAVRAIREAGGVSIWAHPCDSRKGRALDGMAREKYAWPLFEAMLGSWMSWGLDGLETHYPTYDADDIAWSRRMARQHGLLEGGGSDFHGARKINALGDCGPSGPLPESVLERILERAAARASERRAAL